MDSSAATAALEGRYAALRAGAHDLRTDELLDVIELAQREKDAASARRAVALAHLSAREPHLREDGTTHEVHHGLGHQRLDAPELAAPRLGCSVHVAGTRIGTAIRQLTRTPAVVDAMATGDLDEYRASIITDETEFLSDESAAEVVNRVKDHWKGQTPGPLRRLVARTAAQVDPDAVAKEADDERTRRGLTRRTGSHGTDHWRGDFTVEHARGAWEAITTRAKELVRDGHAENLQQARSDAMMELILGHCDVKVVVHTTRAADHDTTHAGDQPTTSPDTKPDTGGGRGGGRHTGGGWDSGPESDPDTPLTSPGAGTNGGDASTVGKTGDTAASHASDAPPLPPPHHRSAAGAAKALVEVGGMGAPGTTFVPRAWLERALHSHDPDGSGWNSSGTHGSNGSGRNDSDRSDRSGDRTSTCRVGAAASTQDLSCHGITGALLAGDVPEALASGRATRSRTRPRAEDPTEKYRIPTEMARLVRLRDGSCRFPGCSTPARQCDLDHVKAWPVGPTDPANLMALCRRHHRIKQRPGWTAKIHPDATVTWTDPTGHRVTTRPVDHLHLVSARATQDLTATAGATYSVIATTAASHSTQPGTLADVLARFLAVPSTFEDDLHEWLAHNPRHPLHSRPLIHSFDGTLLSGPPPHVDLDTGHGPAHHPGPPITVTIDYPPPPPPPDPNRIPF